MRALERQYKTAGKSGTGGASTAGERVGLVLTEETRQRICQKSIGRRYRSGRHGSCPIILKGYVDTQIFGLVYQ